MAKTKKFKKLLVESYRKSLHDSKAIFIIKPIGITANQASFLKKELYDLNSNFNFIKNSIFKIALKEEGLPEFEELNSGEHAIIFSGEEIISTAKIVKNFIKETQKCEIICGLLENEKINAEQIISLADLPSKEQLLAQLLNVMNGSIRGFVTLLNGNIKEFIYLLVSIKQKKEALK